MRAGDVVNRVAATGVRNALPRGEWKRSGRRFVRAVNDLSHVVWLQASQTNEGVRGKFTVNFVVASVAIGRFWYPDARDDPTAWQHRLFEQRIGFLMPANRDHWWTIDAQTDVPALAGEVEAAVCEAAPRFFGLPAVRSCTAMLGELAAGRRLPGLSVPTSGSPMHGVLLCHCGMRAEGLAMLRHNLGEMRAKHAAQTGWPALDGSIKDLEALIRRIERGAQALRSEPRVTRRRGSRARPRALGPRRDRAR